MKHKALAILLAAAMLAALPACGGSADDPSPTPCTSPEAPSTTPENSVPESTAPAESGTPAVDETEPEQSAQPTEPAETPSAPAESPSAAPAPSQSSAPSQAPTPAPSQSEAPSQAPAPEPSMEPAESDSVDLAAFYETLCEDENFGANMALEGEFLTAYYPGLTDIATKQQIVCMPMISSVVCEIALVEVENAADVDAVKAVFQARIDSQVGTDENPGLACYPESIRGWQEDSRIVSNGNYVMMIAWWDYCDSAVTAFNALF